MKRSYGILAAVVVVAALYGAGRLSPGPSDATAVVEESAAPPPRAEAPLEPGTPAGDSAPGAAPPQAPSEPQELVRADPELRERARQHELAPAADARWDEAVDGGRYRAEDLDPGVRELFRRLDLEPRYAEGGHIEGLVIQSLPEGHPLAQVGFRPGDRIDRIQGVALRDPADLPSLLAHLGPRIDFCAQREGAELCREVVLE